jgi:hypothetical protein
VDRRQRSSPKSTKWIISATPGLGGQRGGETALLLPAAVPEPSVETIRKPPQSSPGVVRGLRASRIVRHYELGSSGVTLAFSKITLQARNQAWQPVARQDADCGDRHLSIRTLRTFAEIDALEDSHRAKCHSQ